MKFLLVLVLLILGFVLYLAFGPSHSAPATAPGAEKTAQSGKPAASHHPNSKSSLADDVNSVVSYGVGYTQVKAKRHAAKKLDKINSTHTQELNDQLDK